MGDPHDTVTFTKGMNNAAFEAAAEKLVEWHGGHSSYVDCKRRVLLLRLLAKSAQVTKLDEQKSPRNLNCIS